MRYSGKKNEQHTYLTNRKVYDVQEKVYNYSSKYDGRKLTKDTISAALEKYFFNGADFRLDVSL